MQRPTVVYEEGRRGAAAIGHVPAARVVSGHPPSSNGWIALEDEGFIQDDGSVVDQSPSQAPFAHKVQLPADSLAFRSNIGRQESYIVRYSRVAIRAGPGQEFAILGCINAGDLVTGTRSEANSNWVALSDRPGFVMLKHGRLGTLLEPVGSGASQITVSVPRRPPPAPPARRPAAIKVPVAARPIAEEPTPPMASRALRPAPTAPAPIPTPMTTETAKAASAQSGQKKKRPAIPDVHCQPVLSDVPSSPEHVQPPPEACEYWLAVPGGAFAPLLGTEA